MNIQQKKNNSLITDSLINFVKVALFPVLWIRRKIIHTRIIRLGRNNPKLLASKYYKNVMGKDLDWDNPKDLNEKINWLKFNTDLTEWGRLSDKYRVREYIKERGREDLLVKLYGVWDNVDDINFDDLPDCFVLKSNNGCGTVLLVKNKAELNKKITKKLLKNWLEERFGYLTAEPQYFGIKPLIIAEEMLENDNKQSSSLVDYKVFCLEGNPYCILVCANRVIGKGTELAFYDLNWNRIDDILAGSHKSDMVYIDRPQCLSQLLKAAKDLSFGHHEVRVDFYIANNKLYFGEMTFTSLGGYMDYISPKYLLEMGSLVSLH